MSEYIKLQWTTDLQLDYISSMFDLEKESSKHYIRELNKLLGLEAALVSN